MVLQQLEDNIKDHIFENKDALIPNNSFDVNSKKDFDVNLTDYFDVVSGTSIGSWIALYIAGRGVGSDSIFKDETIKRRYPSMRPGNMETIRALFHVFGREIFPSRGIFTFITRFFRPKYPATGVEKVLGRFFGEATMDDLTTGCLVPSDDLDRHAATSFMRGPANGGTNYTVRTKKRELPKPGDRASDLDIQSGTNYYLRDVATVSAAAPTYFPPHRMKRCDIKNGEEMTLVDGGMISNNPSLQVLTFVGEIYECEVEEVALFSVGCGTSDPKSSEDRDPGLLWWLLSGNLFDILFYGKSEYLQAVMDYWFYKILKVRPGQYLRIQKTAPPGTEMGKMLRSTDGVKYLDELERIGRDLARDNDRAIKDFVKDYIFATHEGN